MSKSLIIVESPAKIKTLKKFLGSNFEIESSIGHIRDLPEKEFGIDIEHDFEPTYVIMPDKQEVIEKLKKAAKKCDTVYLSPDPDREGEAIAWHISQILPPNTKIKRVSFNAITKESVLSALKTPREIDEALVNAQQARRLLDRIVGYKISPILNRRIHRGKEGGVSAGRVQSVALKLVVEREKEIAAFKPVEYWNLSALLKTLEDTRNFKAFLYSVDGKKVEKEAREDKKGFLVPNQETANLLLEELHKGPYKVAHVERKEKRRHPVPPFITSSLQQEASRHYGFSSSRTMSIAQGLYEGIDLGQEGSEGLITYMRTDSVRIEPEAIQAARHFILKNYGSNFIPDQPKVYSTNKSAQDAHEAIRPTNLAYTPEAIQRYLTKDQFHLYQLIWRRFLASQMTPAIYDTVSADIHAGERIVLRATGSQIKFQGFLAIYEEKSDDDDKDEESRLLPQLQEGQALELIELMSEQAFTRPPPRFTEASLVKELEKSGIGRPSTYATIMNKIQSRDYTTKEGGRLKPTELGSVIAALLEGSFQEIMNIGFTASMEDSLELIAENRKDWKTLLREFWKGFSPSVETALKEAFIPKIDTDLDCPQCGSKLQKIWSKSKYFYGCSSYPECNFRASIEELEFNKGNYSADFNWDQKCPICSKEMKIRHGRFGAFLGCTNYPDCKGIINIPKKGEVVIASEDLPHCPAIDCPGNLVARKSRFGKTFYSCSTFPECDVIVNKLEELETKYPNHPRTPYAKKKAPTKKASSKGKTAKTSAKSKAKTPKEKKAGSLFTLSEELSAVLGETELPRAEVLKRIWDYIRQNNLQDEANKRIINPDAKLSKVFGSNDPVDMFKMTGLLSKHIQKKE
ncbi:DNA topoisomerase 1 [Chlamydiales bacterium STE3]|nr:DNA topoisomerase 1 [Chlamydiales bacterium STE3]